MPYKSGRSAGDIANSQEAEVLFRFNRSLLIEGVLGCLVFILISHCVFVGRMNAICSCNTDGTVYYDSVRTARGS